MSINEQVEIIVDDKIKQLAFPSIVTITKVYNDGYVDCKNDEYGKFRHIQTIKDYTSENVGDMSVLIFANNDYNQKIVI